MRLPIQRAIYALVVVAVAARTGHGQNPVYVPPTNQNVVLQQELGIGRVKARIAYVSNLSSVPIIVTEVSVNACQNVKQFCGQNKLNIKVPAGQRREVLRLEPDNPSVAMNYGFRYAWRPDGERKAELGVLAAGGDSGAVRRIATMDHQEQLKQIAAAYHDTTLYSAAIIKLGSKLAGIRAEPDSFVMNVGDVMYVPELRVVAVDANGKVLGRVFASTNYQFAGARVFQFVQPDTIRALAPGRAVITLKVSNPADSARAPFAPVTVNIIVKEP